MIPRSVDGMQIKFEYCLRCRGVKHRAAQRTMEFALFSFMLSRMMAQPELISRSLSLYLHLFGFADE